MSPKPLFDFHSRPSANEASTAVPVGCGRRPSPGSGNGGFSSPALTTLANRPKYPELLILTNPKTGSNLSPGFGLLVPPTSGEGLSPIRTCRFHLPLSALASCGPWLWAPDPGPEPMALAAGASHRLPFPALSVDGDGRCGTVRGAPRRRRGARLPGNGRALVHPRSTGPGIRCGRTWA